MFGTLAEPTCFSSLTLLKIWVKPSADEGSLSSHSPNLGTAADPFSCCHFRNLIPSYSQNHPYENRQLKRRRKEYICTMPSLCPSGLPLHLPGVLGANPWPSNERFLSHEGEFTPTLPPPLRAWWLWWRGDCSRLRSDPALTLFALRCGSVFRAIASGRRGEPGGRRLSISLRLGPFESNEVLMGEAPTGWCSLNDSGFSSGSFGLIIFPATFPFRAVSKHWV